MALQSGGLRPAASYSMTCHAFERSTGLTLRIGKITATRRRLDLALVRRKLASSRTQAQELIDTGRVTVNGAPALKASRLVSDAEAVLVIGPPPRYVSRAGLKLERALDLFQLDVTDRYALDAGSSTGGFTDCLVQRGARHVIAIDVGTNQLHERIRSNSRVTSRENCDIRTVKLADVADAGVADRGFDLVVADLSFISTRAVLSHLRSLMSRDGDLVVLIKPQFEAGREAVSRGRGVISDPAIWVEVLHDFIDEACDKGLQVVDLGLSPITGGKGNVEFLGHLRRDDILVSVDETRETR